MKNSKWIAGPAVLGLTMAMSGISLQAQPNNPPAPNAPNQQGGRGNLTPEQRQQWMRQMQEQRIRGALTPAGFTDVVLQDAVIAFVVEQNQATQELQRKQRDIARAAREGGVADAQLATLLADFRASVAAEQARRVEATKALDAKIGFSTKPRLDALLMTMGVTGTESAVVGGQGGFGGGNRGGRGGGRGGQNRQG